MVFLYTKEVSRVPKVRHSFNPHGINESFSFKWFNLVFTLSCSCQYRGSILPPFKTHTHTIRNCSLCSDEEQTLETSALENLNDSHHGTKDAETFSRARYSQILLTFFNWSFSGALKYSGDLYVAIRWGRIAYFTQRGWITDYREAVLVNHVSDITTLLCTASIHTHMHITEANNRDN